MRAASQQATTACGEQSATPRVLIRGARVLTLNGEVGPRRGDQMTRLGVLPSADVLVEDGKVSRLVSATTHRSNDYDGDQLGLQVIEADGRVLMPGFVDCHTHACWAGDRLDEWEQKQQGATYLELLKAGGGIMSTVRAVRAASVEELADLLLQRLEQMLLHGTTVVEIKSGYGLSTDAELKMLRAIAVAGARWPGRVIPTACLGHALDPEMEPSQFVQQTIDDTLPAISREFPDIPIDAYCEEGAWSVEQCVRLFDRAQQLGHPIRVHADQFHDLGLIPEAIRKGYRSVDHLEATSANHLQLLARSDSFGVMLPCSGFHVDQRYGNGRTFIDSGGALAIATNLNPGSAPCPSVPMAIALAVRHLRITAAEAIVAATANGAALLNIDAGIIREGGRADLVLLHHRDERQLGYEFGANPVAQVVCQGKVCCPS